MASLVRQGTLESAEGGRLSFKPAGREVPDTTGSLFEDAITLNAVRAALLKSSPAAPAAAAGEVRVREGVVFLSLPEDAAPEASAGAVDAALAVNGVRRVVVERTR
ncbi:MAG: hypothetical protein N2322_01935 [Terrimicrobiaceae bacterium]|nr:hypothetical protein [Terrimicrobiaceae bacterium]